MTDQLTGLLAEQARYYRELAGEYEDGWFRRGRYNRGADANARWFAEAAEVQDALERFQPAGRVLELACGTGLWTRRLVAHADTVTAVDASTEMIELAHARMNDPKVSYVQADLFEWEPPASYDVCFFSFWLSHVPEAQFENFGRKSGGHSVPGGEFSSWTASRAIWRPLRIIGCPPRGRTMTRRLADGREFRIVKRFYDPHTLSRRLAELGWNAQVQATAEFFIYGHAIPISEGVEVDRG